MSVVLELKCLIFKVCLFCVPSNQACHALVLAMSEITEFYESNNCLISTYVFGVGPLEDFTSMAFPVVEVKLPAQQWLDSFL